MVKQKTILVIDDEEDIRNITARTLQLEGYYIFQTGDGESGLKILQGSGIIDLVLLDLTMPGMDGWSVFLEMKKDPVLSRIPVIIFSATVSPTRREEALGMGAADYLAKPVSARDLKVSVARCFQVSSRNPLVKPA